MLGLGLGVPAVAARRRGAGGGGEEPVPGWIPTDAVGTMHAWWDGSDGLDVTGTTINSWADKSGNARTLTPTAMVTDTAKFGGAALPRLQTGSYFSRSGVFTPHTTFVVWAQDATIVRATMPIRFLATTTGGYECIASGDASPFLNNELLCYHDATSQFRGATDAAAALASGIDTGGHIFSTRYSSFNVRICLDGGPNLTNAGGGGTPLWDGSSTLYVGHATSPAAGHLAEVIAFETALSLDDMDRMDGYLAHKWGLEGNLPADHPYKAAPPVAA